MKPKKPVYSNRISGLLVGLAAAVVAGASPLGAQQVEEDEEEIIELSPFEISAEETTGYRATSTLAGTRMRMDLKDVGSAVSVYTKEMMTDISADDNETLLAYGLNTEVGGARGNFTNPGSEGLENANLIDPQSNNRIRGLTSADTTRNFFKSDVPWDGYNTDRIDVQRGSNSVLFGLGSPAGIINNATEAAAFRNRYEAQVRVDDFGSLRLSANLNQVLIEDQLAAKVALLRDRREYQQDPAFEDDDRFYAAVTYRPEAFNTDTTKFSVSANYEYGSITANRPRMVVPLDSVSDFFIPSTENGFQGADFQNGALYGPGNDIFGPGGQTYDFVADSETLDTLNVNNGWVRSSNRYWPIFAFDATNPGSFTAFQDAIDATGSFYQASGSRDTAGQTAIVVNDGAFVNPVAAPNRPQDVYVRGTQRNIFGYDRLSTTSEGKRRVASDAGVGFAGFWQTPSLSSTDQYDYMDNLIDGNNKVETLDFDVFDVNLRNTFLDDRLGYQLSFFKQSIDTRQDANLGAIYNPSIQVEANSRDPLSDNLANPAVNPTAGRAFIDYELRLRAGLEDNREREAKQAQIFASIAGDDFTENSFVTYLFGRQDFTGLLKNRQLERFRREFNSIGPDEATMRAFATSAPDDPGLNPRFDPANSDPGPGARMVRLANAFGGVQPRIRVYLDAQGPNLTQIQPFPDPIIPSGSYSIRGFDATPIAGFTAEQAAAEWTTPTGDIEVQANNPANYMGTSANSAKGSFGMLRAIDSAENLEYLTARRFYDQEDVDSKAFVWSGRFLNNAVTGIYGWREDSVDQIGLEHDFSRITEENDEGRTGGPVFDPNSSFVRRTSGDFTSTNWSVALDATQLFFDLTKMDDSKFPFIISLLYNKGEVQNPQPGRRDVLLNDLEPSTGSTTDRSIAISTRDGKYSLRVTKYDTVQQNANAGGVAASENWRIEQVLREGIRNGVVQIEQRTGGWGDNPVLDNGDDIDDPGEISPGRSDEIRAAGFDDVLAWGDAVAADFRDFQNTLFTDWPATTSWITGGEPNSDFIDINFPDDTVFIEDNESFGYEFEFIARPIDNWNIMVNASKTDVLRSRVFGDEVNEVLDFIVGRLAGPAGQVPMWGPEGQMSKTRVDPFLGQLITNRALLGTPTGELRRWKFNLVTSYDFSEGSLKGFGAGVGMRYEDSQVIGFKPIYVDPVTGNPLTERRPDEALSVDLNQPFSDDSRTTFDLWLRYKTRLFDKVDCRFQLNVFNVFDDKGTVPLHINPDGTVGLRGIRAGRSLQFSSTFMF